MGEAAQGMSPEESALELDEDGNPKDEAPAVEEEPPVFVDASKQPAAEEPPAEQAPAQEAVEPPAEQPAEVAAAEQPAEPVPPPLPQTHVAYRTQDVEAMRTERRGLRDKEAEIEKAWSDGTMTDEERGRKLNDLRDRQDELLANISTATALAEASRQNEAHAQQAVLSMIRASAQGVIDYGKPAAAGAFDAAMQAVAAVPENAGMSFAELAQKAHAEVLASFGLAAKPAPAAAPAAAPKPAAAVYAARAAAAVDKGDFPPTLSRVPAAAEANVQGDEFSHISALSGIDRERAVAKLTPEQLDRYLG